MKLLSALIVLSVAVVSPAQLTNIRKGYWNIKVSYPTFKNRSVTAGPANQDARRRERIAYNEFLAQAKRDLPALKKMNSAAQYELLITPTISLDNAKFCTGYVTRYDFTGGAHGNTSHDTLNYTVSGKNLKLQDLFLRGQNGRAICSAALVKKLKEEKIGSSVESGAWTKLDNDQAKRFVITKTGLLFLFNSYDLGSYAEGAAQCLIPYSSLTGLNPKVLGTLISTSKVDPNLTRATWIFESIKYNDDKVLYGENGGAYTLKIDASGKVSGQAGANRITSSVTAANGDLRFAPFASTRMADPPNSIAPKYLKELVSVKRYMFSEGNLILMLPYDSGVMTFTKSE